MVVEQPVFVDERRFGPMPDAVAFVLVWIDMALVLHQFEVSHFNEKARWALAFKGVEHQRKSYLPGLHAAPIRKLSGQAQTPVLEADGEVVSGSAEIIDRLETTYPDPPLYPSDAGLRAEALAFQARFDADVGPAVRTVVFVALLQGGDYIPSIFSQSKPALMRAAYKAVFPMAKAKVARENGAADAENVERAMAMTERALDEVAGAVRRDGYICGGSFGIADLTAAALLAPIADIQHPDMLKPRPMPKAVEETLAQYDAHPAIKWVHTMYETHR